MCQREALRVDENRHAKVVVIGIGVQEELFVPWGNDVMHGCSLSLGRIRGQGNRRTGSCSPGKRVWIDEERRGQDIDE
jgi:hypothetical protein